ncbi:LOW QUALITY PROTEIN: histamine H2 receptor [Rhineura floridana]|uniref:LOW QUALITY PROTEIN: histamine H2 receptor n=1 Tax=Rhineura floridana TaxID=261503 RepID=UPI002AC7ED17|nr:LOW QUALITY PROTEIN: histamine H2 receptor [Rhineura floridana]
MVLLHHTTMNSTDSTVSLGNVLLGIGLAALIIVTVCGNVMVCLAVYFNRRLRSLTNCFIVSLAFTDLLLGLVVLPFSAIYEISSHKWLFDITLCNIYISFDVMLCTASILNLFMISLDRYYAITAPLRYTTVVTPLRVAVAMFLIWVVSLMVSFLPIHLGWNTNDATIQNTRLTNGTQECKLEVNAMYVLVDGLLTFYLPLLVMCITYYRIFKIAREQAKRINHTNCCKTVKHALPTVKEHKATVTLAAVMGAFIICWFPYFTVFTYRGMMGTVCDTLLTVVMWLGYANSALNPILYAALNRDFRTAYQRLLRCWKVGPDAREVSLSHEMRDKTCNQENKPLQLHAMNGNKNPLVQDGIERNLNPPCNTSSSTILSCCQSLWLAKVLPQRDKWIPMFEEPTANAQKTRQPSAPHTVIYCVFS